MRGRVLKPFNYAADHIHLEWMEVGQECDFADDVFPGLMAEGYVSSVETKMDVAEEVALVKPARKRGA